MTDTAAVRMPAVAGSFYPSQPVELSTLVRKLLDQLPIPPQSGTIIGLISPHAGYQYSGATAAHGFRCVEGQTFDTVVVVSPSHREYFRGISVYPGRAYATPLGEMEIDSDLREALVTGDKKITASAKGHVSEHALEVQLPFIQSTLGAAKLLPIVMGDQRAEYCERLGNKLGEILSGKRTLLIASTDLSHYHDYASANVLDGVFVADLLSFDPHTLLNHLDAKRTEACGGGPTAAVLIAAKALGADTVHLLHHCNSGDVTGEHSQVVGYLSATISKS
ncbi:MAG TPA: AmmeMemoRadiSam system protein B [Bacteroidota bacterium]|nr:AmmeMemoRadiSam system protein B [Bacteroidota bacterium]